MSIITKITATFDDGSSADLFPVAVPVVPEVINVPLDTPIEIHEETSIIPA